MDILLGLTETFIYFHGITLILDKAYAKSKNYALKLIINISFRVILLVLSFFIKDLALGVFFIITLTDIIFLKLIFKNFRIKSSLSAYALFYSLQTIFSSIIAFILNQYLDPVILTFAGTVTGILIVVISLIIIYTNPNILHSILIIPKGVKRLCIASIISSAIVTYLLLCVNSVYNTSEWNTASKLLLIFFIVTVGSVFPAIVANAIGKVYYERKFKGVEEQVKLQAKHYEEMAKSNMELRRFKHDYKNILIGVTELIQDGDTQGALALLEVESGSCLSQSSQSFETGNGIVDAILYDKQRRAEAVNSTIKFEGAVPSETISPTDLCVIFGNTLDNAIEACESLRLDSKNVISVSCRSAGGFVFVNISNPVKDNIPISHNMIKTTKQNRADHGFGLYSLKKAAKKYNGTMKLSCTDRIFSVDLELEISA